MFRKNFSVNLFLSIMFLVTTFHPTPLFSSDAAPLDLMGKSHVQTNWVDESLEYRIGLHKKTRCPRCGMEFYYVPGKEGPHSLWIRYQEESVTDKFDSNEVEKGKEKGKVKAFSDIEKKLFKTDLEGRALIDLYDSLQGLKEEKSELVQQLEKIKIKEYALKQKLICPYDGYVFFPDRDVVEEQKLFKDGDSLSSLEEPSIVENSFSKTMPFGVSRDLKQFGYELFKTPEKERQKEIEKDISTAVSGASDALTTLAMLKASVTSPTSPTQQFSSQSVQTAVVPVGPDYIIGPGDRLVINIWGSVQETFPADVDREGKIMLPKTGPLYLWGVKFKDAENMIKQRLNQFYTNFKVDVSMGKLRDIQVFVMGEVKKPGSYTISSQENIFQALYSSGGPTKMGSLRKIKIIRMDGKEEVVDLYDFLIKGEKLEHSKIQSGDTIFISSLGDVVAIAGNVKRPGIYETKSEMPLGDLLAYAGGITPIGDLQRLQIERVKNNEKRIMLDMELTGKDIGESSLGNINLQNGDMVIVAPIVRLRHDFISIIGNVERPGDYALTKDMKISVLIERAKGFLPATYLHRAELSRVTEDRTRQLIPVDLENIMLGNEEADILLNEWDILLIYSQAEVQPPSYVEIDGAINRPGKYELSPNMKISDLIFKAGGVKIQEAVRGAELFHIITGDQPVIVDVSIQQPSEGTISIEKDILLNSGDAVFIKSEPKLSERRTATIKGEVRFPGTYSIRKGERLSSVIERAGGYTNEAFLEGAVFTRESIRKIQERIRKDFIEKENRTILQEQQSLLLRSGARAENITEIIKARRDILSFIESAEIEGRMVIPLGEIPEFKNSRPDILLEDGDSLTIPQIASTIAVIGSVNNPTSVFFEPSKGVEYYIRKTGGLTKHADKKGIYVIHANGEAVGKFMTAKEIKRGDTIVIPQEFKYGTPPGQVLRDTVDMLSRIAIGVGIVAALN